MSTNPLDLPILISQLPNVQQALGPQYIPAEAQQVLFGQIVADNQRKEEQNVQEVEKQDGLDAMGRDAGGNNKEAQLQARHQQTRSNKPPPAQDEPVTATQSSNASPWAGNIINIKI